MTMSNWDKDYNFGIPPLGVIIVILVAVIAVAYGL